MGSASRFVGRMERLYFLFGCRIKVELSGSVPCLVQEFELKEIKRVYNIYERDFEIKMISLTQYT
jgi:hypothetical protein